MPNGHSHITLFLLLLLWLSADLTSGAGLPVGSRSDMSSAKEEQEEVRGVSTAAAPVMVPRSASTSTTTKGTRELMRRFGFRPPNLVLLLHTNGTLSARSLETGLSMWRVETGGNLMQIEIEEEPSEELAQKNPFALPFVLEGDMLFTRRRFSSWVHGQDLPNGRHPVRVVKPQKGEEERDEDPARAEGCSFSPPHSLYFMNLSTLIRRRHVHLGGTDIFVTTSARIMDISSHMGKVLQIPDPLLAYLHLVRYDTTVHAHSRGNYKWKMRIAQYKISEGSPSRGSSASMEEEDPRLVFRMLQEMMHREGVPSGHTPPTGAFVSRMTETEKLEPTLNVGRKGNLANLLYLKEVEKQKYTLWNSLTSTPFWSAAVGPISDVSTAFVWMGDGAGVQPVPVYRLVTLPSTSSKRTETPTTCLPVSENKEWWSQTPLISDRPWGEHSISLELIRSIWEHDIDADERENYELRNSYQQCSWVYGCADPSAVGPNNSLINDYWATETFQFLPAMSLLWSQTATQRTVFIAFHVICFMISSTFVCFGVVHRRRLRNAWAQVDALMDDIRNSSRSSSTKLTPQDRAINGEATGNSVALVKQAMTPFKIPDRCADFSSIGSPFIDNICPLPESLYEVTRDAADSADSWWKYPEGEDDSSLSERQSTGVAAPSSSVANTPQLFQQHFNLLSKIGYGAEGSVFCVEHRVTSTKYAIKAIRIRAEDKQRCVQEAILHSSLDFPNVVRFFYSWIELVPLHVAETKGILGNRDLLDTPSGSTEECSRSVTLMESSSNDLFCTVLFIQMEYFRLGTLADHFLNRQHFTRQTNLEHLVQIAEGMRYLHQQDVVHRDLKPTNIFVSDFQVMKIGDFGLAKKRAGQAGTIRNGADELASNAVAGEEERSIAGCSPLYSSPEQLWGGTATAASDVYSLGLIAVEFYCFFNTLHERFRTLGEARRAVFPTKLDELYREEAELFRRMLCESIEDRPSMDEVVRVLRRIMREIRNRSCTTQPITRDSIISTRGEDNDGLHTMPLHNLCADGGQSSQSLQKLDALSVSSLESTNPTYAL